MGVNWIDVIFPRPAPTTCMLYAEKLELSEKDENPARDSLRALIVFALFALTFGAFMLASLFRAAWAQRRVLPLLSLVGGGVFLATCLLDLLPDALESFEKAEVSFSFPLAEACVGLGFMIVLSIEQLAIYLQEIGVIGSGHVQLHEHDGETIEEENEHRSESNRHDENASISAIIMVVAISLHALFEGISLAVISDPPKLLEIFLALAIHKTIIGFTLGVRLWQSGLRPLIITLCGAILAMQVIVGGLGGIGIMHFLSGGSRSTASLVTTILQGISCGTFLYITTFEILPHELDKPGFRMQKLASIFVGCVIVIAFTLCFPDA
ncbi:unnamed protein product, partial [Mesorhabditis belari]|uniref:Zinc transporter ZIP1 n=1 Tax=Mesorhabditis belari TaxID=2138241 RepID=A0AAF3EJF3_9BILA